MFVTQNTLAAINAYFTKKLEAKFSKTEIRFMFRELACHRLQKAYADILMADNCLLSESDLLYFRSCANRLLAEEPFQYILGFTYFHSIRLQCTPAALIPRPETEELVAWILETTPKNATILDLCTGTGCIALALKSAEMSYTISAVDVSVEAINLAKENAASNQLDATIQQGDILEENWLQRLEKNSFDVWVSNPPYIPEDEKTQMAANVLQFEPHLALFVPTNKALLFYSKIAVDALSYLKPKGILYFEIHELQANSIVKLLNEFGYINIELRKDLQGKDRMIKAQKP